MKKAIVIVILLGCIVGLDVIVGRSGISGDQASAGEFEEKMSIGLLAPLSGEKSADGRSAKRGFELAVRGLRAWGLSVELEDTRCDAQYAIGAVNRLLRAGADAVVGGLCPSVANVVEEALAEQGVPYVALDVGESATVYRLDSYIDKEEALADYFVDGHKENYGARPDYIAALAFDTLTAVTMELRDGMPSDEDPLQFLRETVHYGVSGEVKFR